MATIGPTEAKTATETKTKKQSIDPHALVTEMDKFHKTYHSGVVPSMFKALDFSDVSIYGQDKSNSTDYADERFRHFHQMRLYIQYGKTNHHNKALDQQVMIVSNLPEKVSYALNSKWEAPLDFGDAATNLLIQMGSQVLDSDRKIIPSGTLRVSSLKVWQKTEPLSLELTIPVLDDTNSNSGTNLVEALEILGSLCLPRYSSEDSMGFYTPPPSSLSYKLHYTRFWEGSNRPEDFEMSVANKARIILQLGGILLVDNCIIESVAVNYPNTKAQIMHKYDVNEGDEIFGETGHKYLHPLLAEVRLKISTLEALTSDVYSEMLWARSDKQAGQGTVQSDLSTITNPLNSLRNYMLAEPKASDGKPIQLPESSPDGYQTPLVPNQIGEVPFDPPLGG